MADPNQLPFEEWTPDKSTRANPTAEAIGVHSIAGQYAPFPDFQDYGPDPTVDEFTKVLLHLDGEDTSTTITDDAPDVSHVWTVAGGAQIDIDESVFGDASLILDGTGDFITTPDTPDITLADSEWTIDLWIKCDATSGSLENIAGQMDAGLTEANSAWGLWRESTGQLRFTVSMNGSTFETIDSVSTFSDTHNSDWAHIAIVRLGNYISMFVNGVREGNSLVVSGSVTDSNQLLGVGCLGGNTADPWTGWIDEFRISVGIARFVEPDTIPGAVEGNEGSYTWILIHGDGENGQTFLGDDSVNAGFFLNAQRVWTVAGSAQIDTAVSKFGGGSMLFDGIDSWWTTPASGDLDLTTSDFTIDFWFNCDAAAGTIENIAGQGDAAGTNAGTAFAILRTAANIIKCRACVGASAFDVDSTTTFTATGWHHLAFVRTGNTLKLFIDGTQEGGDVSISGSINVSADVFAIGQAGASAANPWTGWIDEFRVSIGIARWTANFTPPTAAYSGSTFTSPTAAAHFGGGAENTVLGADTFYDSDTDPHIFYGDASRLYTLESRTSVDISNGAGYSLSSSHTWQFAQFGDNVVAVSAAVTTPQLYVMGTSTDFDDLTGSPPTNASSVARVGDFLWMGEGFTVHWSAFDDITDWVPNTATQAGNQQLDQERGEIMTLIGLDYAAIFQERGIRRAIYVGPPVIWDFGQDYIEKARGCISRNAAVPFGRVIFYAADDGFYMFDGQSSTSIGYGKVDDYYVRNLNYAFRHKVSCGIDYLRKLVVWGIPSGSSQLISELLIYSMADKRWTHDFIDLEFVFDTPSEPLTVDNFSLLYSEDDLDMSGIIPDDIDSAAYDDRRIRLAAFNTSHQMGLFVGANRAATMDTKEFEPLPGRRALLTEVWPLGDYQQGYVSSQIGYRRARPGQTMLYTNASSMNNSGYCPQRIDARFMKIRQQIAAEAVWYRGEGVHFTAIPTGKR